MSKSCTIMSKSLTIVPSLTTEGAGSYHVSVALSASSVPFTMKQTPFLCVVVVKLSICKTVIS